MPQVHSTHPLFSPDISTKRPSKLENSFFHALESSGRHNFSTPRGRAPFRHSPVFLFSKALCSQGLTLFDTREVETSRSRPFFSGSWPFISAGPLTRCLTELRRYFPCKDQKRSGQQTPTCHLALQGYRQQEMPSCNRQNFARPSGHFIKHL